MPCTDRNARVNASPEWHTPGNTGAVIRLKDANSMAWRRAQVPAVNGFGNARSVALVQSVLVNQGSAGGVRLLSPRGCEPAWQEVFCGDDRVLGTPMSWAVGFGKFGNTFGWGGWAARWS
jgi:hypothetical protein